MPIGLSPHPSLTGVDICKVFKGIADLGADMPSYGMRSPEWENTQGPEARRVGSLTSSHWV